MTEPRTSRPIFSTEDFALLKEAVSDYLQNLPEAKKVKFVNLYHRLGRSC